MSIDELRSALATSDLTPLQRYLVALVLLGVDSVPAFVAESGLSERAVRKHLAVCSDEGWLKAERCGKEHVYSLHVAAHSLHEVHTLHQPLPLIEVFTSNAREAKPSRRKKETTFPDDFTITPSMRSWLTENDLGHLKVEQETQRFHDHALSVDRRCRDWVAAWRNWMRKAGEFTPAPAEGGKRQGTGHWFPK